MMRWIGILLVIGLISCSSPELADLRLENQLLLEEAERQSEIATVAAADARIAQNQAEREKEAADAARREAELQHLKVLELEEKLKKCQGN